MSWSSIPTEALLAELSSRGDVDTKPQCGSRERGAYDTPLHVGALILILALSTLGKDYLSLHNAVLWIRRRSRKDTKVVRSS